jgi:hypothetical protein
MIPNKSFFFTTSPFLTFGTNPKKIPPLRLILIAVLVLLYWQSHFQEWIWKNSYIYLFPLLKITQKATICYYFLKNWSILVSELCITSLMCPVIVIWRDKSLQLTVGCSKSRGYINLVNKTRIVHNRGCYGRFDPAICTIGELYIGTNLPYQDNAIALSFPCAKHRSP